MALNLLTDSQLKQPAAKRRLFDGGGLFLLVKPNGSRLWRFKYRFESREKQISFGRYPNVTLRRAREKRDEARELLDHGKDPSAHRKAARKATELALRSSFACVAHEWFKHYCEQKARSNTPLAAATIERTEWLLDLPAYRVRIARANGNEQAPAHPLRSLNSKPIYAITRDDVALVIQGLLKRDKIETAHRLLDRLDKVFRYAIGTRRMDHNPAAAFKDSADPRDKIPTRIAKSFAAVTKPQEVGALLRAIDGYRGHIVTEYAMRIAPYVFVRPGELRAALWSEFDLESAEPTWRIAAARTKMRREHAVPLASQVVSLIQELRTMTGPDGLVFPSIRDPRRPLSENAITAALRRMGYTGDQMTWHGFRTTASTMLNEQGWEPDVIELQLAHQDSNSTRAVYNRSTRLIERRKMMQAWADYLDGLKSGSNVITLRRTA